MKPMPDLNAFAAECHEISKSKGWTDLPRSDAQVIDLMVSENSEALEEFRNHRGVTEIYYEEISSHRVEADGSETLVEKARKPCGIPIELADTVIRIGQHCGTEGLDLAAAAASTRNGVVRRADLCEAIADATLFLSAAWVCAPSGREVVYKMIDEIPDGRLVFESMKPFDGGVVKFLALAVWSIALFCEGADIDLWAAVEEKMIFNRSRPHRHGGKKC